MHALRKSVPIMLLILFLPLQAEIKSVDVTGDGIEDEVKIGERSVIVVDGATGERWMIWEGQNTEKYSEDLAECTVLAFKNKSLLNVKRSWYGTARGGDMPALICYYADGKWHSIEESRQESDEIIVKANNTADISVVLANDELLVIEQIEYRGASGGIILKDYGMKLRIFSSEGDEYFAKTLSEIGNALTDFAVEWRRFPDPITVYLQFDNSEAASLQRTAYYLLRVYGGK